MPDRRVHAFHVVFALVAGSLAGCDDARSLTSDGGQSCVTAETFKIDGNPRVDVLFVIDDSPAMAGMQDKLAKAFPSFMTAFIDPAWGTYPDLHVAVVSSSMGGGRFANVPGCEAGSSGARDGSFVHPGGAGLASGETFMRFNDVPINFQGDPGAVFSALATVGTGGCPYPQPLQAVLRALSRAQDPSDPDNAGFLRANARLVIVVVTDQDDCSIPADSDLFDPGQVSVADSYGGTGPYRCAEFGWLCDGVKPPHALAAASSVALDGCVPAEGVGRLTPVADLVAALQGLKSDPDDVSVSLIGAPATPVVVGQRAVDPGHGVSEDQPMLQPACTGTSGELATPGVRLKAWADGFAANGLFLPACADGGMLSTAVSAQFWRVFDDGTECLYGVPVPTGAGLPNCVVTQTSVDEAGNQVAWQLPACDADRTVLPCWKIDVKATWCIDVGPALTVCRNPACTSARSLTPEGSVAVRCQVAC